MGCNPNRAQDSNPSLIRKVLGFLEYVLIFTFAFQSAPLVYKSRFSHVTYKDRTSE
jgi:hypothetical protein